MKVIYKYPLALVDLQLIKLPYGCRILDIQFQNGQLCLWALVDPNQTLANTEIEIVGTGFQTTADPDDYFKTVQEGSYVWHIFVRG